MTSQENVFFKGYVLFCCQFWRISTFYGMGFPLSFFRSDHGLGPEGSMGPPGQSNMVPSNSDPSMYSPNRYPGQQR